MNARIIELEGALEQQRSRSSKLEKEKNRLVVEIREITIDLENVKQLIEFINQYSLRA